MSPAYSKTLTLEILTLTGSIFREDVLSMQFPTTDGLVGILPGRAPLIAIVGAGGLVTKTAAGQKRTFYVSGGFAHVREEGVVVLAEEATPVEKLDAEDIWEQLQTVRKLPADTDDEYAYRTALVEEAQMKFKLAMARTPKGMRRSAAEGAGE